MKIRQKVVVPAGAVLFVALVAGLTMQSSLAFSLRELLGLGDDPETTEAAVEAPAEPAAKQPGPPAAGKGDNDWARQVVDPDPQFRLADIQHIVVALDDADRKALLADEQTFRKFVDQEAGNVSVLKAALANNLQNDENTRFLMRRGAERILRETYINALVSKKIPKDFPTDDQVREFYDKNKDKFVVGERMHVWQIFLPYAEGMPDKAKQELEKKAENLSKDIASGKLDFGKAALANSGNDASKYNGGYMGLIAVSELKPEVRPALDALAEGKISAPVKTDTGIHIFKRGARIPQEHLSFETARDGIRKTLRSQARNQLRAAIYEQAGKTYPTRPDDKKIEEMRLRLRTDVGAAPAAGKAKSPAPEAH